MLVERLRCAWGGQALLSEVEKGADALDLPSEGDEPREALLRLRDQLASLEERLIRQENGERRRRAWYRRADPQGTPGEAIGVGAALIAEESPPGRSASCFSMRPTASRTTISVFASRSAMRLLIASLEVAHAEGNTTYGLVRRTTGDGCEDVVASGCGRGPRPDVGLGGRRPGAALSALSARSSGDVVSRRLLMRSQSFPGHAPPGGLTNSGSSRTGGPSSSRSLCVSGPLGVKASPTWQHMAFRPRRMVGTVFSTHAEPRPSQSFPRALRPIPWPRSRRPSVRRSRRPRRLTWLGAPAPTCRAQGADPSRRHLPDRRRARARRGCHPGAGLHGRPSAQGRAICAGSVHRSGRTSSTATASGTVAVCPSE